MCLAIPGKVTELFEENGLKMGKVDFGGVSKTVCTEHVPNLSVGDYALVHVGFVLSRIDEEEAKRVFAFLEQISDLGELREEGHDEISG